MLKLIAGICLAMLSGCFSLAAQENPKLSLETYINSQLEGFGLTSNNYLRVATYAEMRGVLAPGGEGMILDIGDLGSLKIYPRNCLLKTFDNHVYSLDRWEDDPEAIGRFNEGLEKIFDQIFLLSNLHAALDKVNFIDKYLALKNIEPFQKLFVRHLLIKYGDYDADKQSVLFHSDWLPDELPKGSEGALIRKPEKPIKIRLDTRTLRGWYLWSGGTVFVENVDRNVPFATGEIFAPNVMAFKEFTQDLLIHSIQYISYHQAERLRARFTAGKPTPRKKRTYSKGGTLASITGVGPLYHPMDWISMMLGILRASRINIGDPDVIVYFVKQPFFQNLYEQLNEEERSKVDNFLEAKM